MQFGGGVLHARDFSDSLLAQLDQIRRAAHPHGVARLSFRKVEGLGNDFLLLDRRDRSPVELERELAGLRELAPRLCDRRTGVGGDGILVVGPGQAPALAAMIVVNFDGSRPEMCGNGLRCVAAFVASQHGELEQLQLDTDAGPRACRITGAGPGGATMVSVAMGPAARLGTRTPAAAGGRELVGVSMGNPHAIAFVGPDEDPEALARELGPAIELAPDYAPAKTNVEFARVEADGSILLWVWERGVGITSACGTGACASAVAAVDLGLLEPDAPIRVRLPGGALDITVPGYPKTKVEPEVAAEVVMAGPARQVFVGELELPAASTG